MSFRWTSFAHLTPNNRSFVLDEFVSVNNITRVRKSCLASFAVVRVVNMSIKQTFFKIAIIGFTVKLVSLIMSLALIITQLNLSRTSKTDIMPLKITPIVNELVIKILATSAKFKSTTPSLVMEISFAIIVIPTELNITATLAMILLSLSPIGRKDTVKTARFIIVALIKVKIAILNPF